MATLKINVMSIVAIVLIVTGIVALGCYEGPIRPHAYRSDTMNTYEAFIIIPIILAIVVLIVTCLDVESITGKTFLLYGLAALLLLIGIIIFGVVLHDMNSVGYIRNIGYVKAPDAWIASIVFAALAFIAAAVGAVAPFVCK